MSEPNVIETALVTGGAGFIGSHLVDALLARGARVAVLDNLQDGHWHNVPVARLAARLEVDLADADATDAAVAQVAPSRVFHLAANASVPRSVEAPAHDFRSNTVATFALLDAVRRHAPAARVVVASSGAVYGEPTTFPIDEDTPLAPISPYGYSKLATEQLAQMFARVYGLSVSVARLFNTYGPRMPRFVILDFIRKLKADPTRLEILGDGRQVRDFNHVCDAVAALLRIADRGDVGAAYNVASGTAHDVTTLARRLLAVMGLEGATLSTTGRSWTGDAQRWEVDIDRLRALGHAPAVSLDEGLATVLAWFEADRPASD